MGGEQLQALSGLIVFPLIAWAISENRAHLGLRRALVIVAGTLAAQFAIALVIINLPLARHLFEALGGAVLAVQQATETGARLCHMADDAGSLAPGKLADLIVVDGDPLADIGLLGADGKHVSAIMARGRFFKNELGGTQ